MMLRHPKLNHIEQNMGIGQLPCTLDVNQTLSAFRSAYRNKQPHITSHVIHSGNQFANLTQPLDSRNHPEQNLHQQCWGTIDTQRYKSSDISAVNNPNDDTQPSIDTIRQCQKPRQKTSHFSFFHSNQSPSETLHAIIASGACASLIGKDSLQAIRWDFVAKVLNAVRFQRDIYSFGNTSNG